MTAISTETQDKGEERRRKEEELWNGSDRKRQHREEVDILTTGIPNLLQGLHVDHVHYHQQQRGKIMQQFRDVIRQATTEAKGWIVTIDVMIACPGMTAIPQ